MLRAVLYWHQQAMPILNRSKQLKKSLSLFNVYTLATGATLSSGFFLLPGLAAVDAGPAVILSYLLALLPLMPGVLAKIELATAMPRAGGEYYFLDRSLGPLAGTIAGMGTWSSLILKTAFALIGIGAYIDLFYPELPMVPLAAGLAIAFGVLNLFGASKSSVVQTWLVIALLILLIWFSASGFSHIHHHEQNYFSGFLDRGWPSIFAASGMVCISYMGITKVASVAEEVKNPERNLPLGIFLAMLTAVVVYGLGTYVIVGLVPPDSLYAGETASLTPVADAAKVMAGTKGMAVMTVAAVLAFLSVGNAGILSASRYPLAMSRDHLLPSALGRLNRHKAPQNAIFFTTAAVLICVVAFDPTKIAKLASAFILLLFAFNCLAVIVMRESRLDSYDPGFRSPWYPWLHLAGVAAPLWYISLMGTLPVLFSAGLIAIGTGWYFYYAQSRVVRGGAIYHLFARLGQRQYAGLDRELRGILKEKGLRIDDPYDQIVARAAVINEPGQTTFEDIVHKAAGKLAVHLPVSAEQLADSIMEGTRVGATPVSKGVALPHVRLPGLDHALMVLVRTPKGVSVQIDHNLTDHGKDQSIYAAIFLVSPEDDAALHLRILAQVAQHVDDEQFMTKWLATDDERKLKEALLHEERFFQLVLEQDVPSEALIDQPLRDLHLPEGCLVAIVDRASEMIVPRGDTILRLGDRLTIVGLPDSIVELRQRYYPM
jgi:basic amino acid/polyamine antiporter, APA family